MPEFFLTFGSQYAHSDSWVRIEAPDCKTAREAAFEHFGTKWSMLYSSYHFNPRYFPSGELFSFSTDKHLNYQRSPARELV